MGSQLSGRDQKMKTTMLKRDNKAARCQGVCMLEKKYVLNIRLGQTGGSTLVLASYIFIFHLHLTIRRVDKRSSLISERNKK